MRTLYCPTTCYYYSYYYCSPRESGMRLSSSSAIITQGSVKTSVLPEPVKAIPIMSRPERIVGRPWIWIGVGLLMPRAWAGGGRGSGPPSGSRKYAQGGQGGGAGKQHQVRAGRMALRVGFEQGFPGFRSVLVSAHIPT